jgi:hypothetical protein
MKRARRGLNKQWRWRVFHVLEPASLPEAVNSGKHSIVRSMARVLGLIICALAFSDHSQTSLLWSSGESLAEKASTSQALDGDQSFYGSR